MNLSSSKTNIQITADSFVDDRLQMLENLVGNMDALVYCNLYDEFWTMIFASAGCKDLTGYNPNDLIFNNLISYEKITFEKDRKMVRDKIDEAVKLGTRFEIEYRIQHANGSIIWVSERGNPIYNDQGQIHAIKGLIQNITKRKNIEQSLRDTESRYRSIFENAIEGIFQTSPNGRYLMVNPALARMYGYNSPEDLISALNNIQQQLYVASGRREEFVQAIENHQNVQNFESLVYKKDGSTIWISENARMVYDEVGVLLYYEGTVEDITARKSYDAQLEHQATHDSLTGLPNRYMLNDRLQQCINFADRYKNKIAVAFIDLDQFKLINDSMGHEVGDQLLLIMSQRLSSCVREIDTVVRLGGDEFVILITNIDNVNDISLSMQRILTSVAEPCMINELDYLVTCSVGISIYPDDGVEPNALLKNADSAMYKAKKAGRNNYQIYTKALNKALTERVMMEYKLRLAIEHDEFLLYYQPKVDFATGLISGAEALIRWQPPGEELIEPMRFIQIAEETGLIEKIGEWVLTTACKKAKELKEKTGRPFPIAVNVSPRQFRQPNLAETIKQILEATELDSDCLELEITESTLIDDAAKFIETLHSLKKIGVKLAIDDFGTGYSSLAYLKDFPIDRLKIDKAFVSSLEKDPANMAILKAIIVLGQSLGMKVIAEGVETGYQYDYLKSIGCDELQGYYFSKPLPEIGLEALVMNQSKLK
ncbi:MAG: EAL domain-containing protein [Methylotenera sp.]|nr:EAL domain-containing protein [Methylotenera sp.]MDO9387952.1 EAL domain-containing protein [Methylotenera sp.]MDP2102746.1 EAL domain-containing protein [Methylotenera sp.]MDP2282386.1 EAL domain-containing protein [Methylotenera sp.]MDP3061490.1 EAL domain-containing protein [Methylotenera sp.]